MSNYVITFLANTTYAMLDDRWIDSVEDTFLTDVRLVGRKWLEEDKACDVIIGGALDAKMWQALWLCAHDMQIDAVLQPAVGRRKRMLISDMDSTMIAQECVDELADFAGLKDEVAAITHKAMNGELEFKAALKERVALLKGLQESVLQEAYDKHITLMPGARTLVQTMRKYNAYCLLVSGGFTFFTSRVAEALGFHDHESNVLDIDEGVLTGTVQEPIRDKEAKLEALQAACKVHNLQSEEVLAIGDGANDLPMLLAAGLGVAYHAKPAVQDQAKAVLCYSDLSGLLYVQGYERGEWVV